MAIGTKRTATTAATKRAATKRAATKRAATKRAATEQPAADYTIGQLAKSAGVGIETVRFYHRRGLLPKPARRTGSIRRYDADGLARLSFIRRAQRLGFSLDEVHTLLELNDGKSCQAAQTLAQSKLAEIEARLRDLRQLRAVLRDLIGRCEHAAGRVACPLIERLHGTADGG